MAFTRFPDPTNNISNLANQPVEPPATLKQKFDQVGEDLKDWANNTFLPELEAITNGDSGADNIGATPVGSGVAENVQGVLEELDAKIDTQLPTPDGSITDAKLSNTAGQIKDVVSDHTAQLLSSAQYLTPTGTGNDTAYLNNAISNYPVVVLKSGTYYVDPTLDGGNYGWVIPSNRIIFFEQGAILQAITNSDDEYRIVYISNSDNVYIYNPVVYGDKLTHTGVTGEGGHGIYLSNGSANIKIYNPICNTCWGVGIGVVDALNVYVENAICDNNRQNGIAIIKGKDLTFVNPVCTNTSGTLPSAGIDIEPNVNTDYLENINIINPVTKNNAGRGIDLALMKLKDGTNNILINVENHYDDGSESGLYVAKLEKGTLGVNKGKISISNSLYVNSKLNGLFIEDYSSENTPSLIIDKPVIINPNDSSSAIVRRASGIVIYREADAISTNKMGNITIINPDISDIRTVTKMIIGIYTGDAKSVGFNKISIDSPIKIDGVDSNYKVWLSSTGIKFLDNYNVCKLSTTTTPTNLLERVYTTIDNLTAPSIVNFNLPDSTLLIDAPTTFINKTFAAGIKITPPAGVSIRPVSTVNGKYIQTTLIGSSITIRKYSSTIWFVENIIGTWTVEP